MDVKGVHRNDKIIAEQLRKTGRPVLLLVNKAEGMQRAAVTNEFFVVGYRRAAANLLSTWR